MRKDEHEQTEILYREPKFYPSHNINLRVISEETPAALSRTPKGRPQAGSRHSSKGEHLQNPNGCHVRVTAYGIQSNPV